MAPGLRHRPLPATGVSHTLPPTSQTTGPKPPETSPPTTSPPTTTNSRSVETFVVEYAAALDRDDIAFLLDRLHPVVISAYGADLCRDWIEREIVTLEGYRLTGPVLGPSPLRVAIPDGETVIDDAFSAPVSFVFQGSTVDAEAGFASIDGVIHWLGIRR